MRIEAKALAVALLVTAYAAYAADDGPVYFELDPRPNDVIVFLASAIPESLVRYLAVYRSSAPPRADGAAYSRVEDAADCETHMVTAHYTAYAEDGRPISASDTVPPDVTALLDAHHRAATEAYLCRWQTGGVAPVMAPDIRSSLDRVRPYHGDAEVLARARAVDAALQTVEHLADTGRFFAIGGDPRDGLMYFDMSATARVANEATVSWVYVPPPARKISAAYFRVEFKALCDAQTGERAFAAGFDPHGALVSFSGPSPTLPFARMKEYAQWLSQACNGLHPRWFDKTYKSLAKVLDDAHAAMSG